MSAWDLYTDRIVAMGKTKRNVSYQREARYITNKVKDNLSYFVVDIDNTEREVAIINSDNLNEKRIISMPGESLVCGALVSWMDNKWLITELDANSTIYMRAKMIQCNHLLKWVSGDGVIHEQWCIVEDGTKYLTGEYEDRNFVVTRGDSRIAVTLPRNEFTSQLTRKNRFLIDDPDSPQKLAYLLTKPLKTGLTYNDQGVYKFVLQEVTSTDDDNQELGIADYYKYFPKPPVDGLPQNTTGKESWL